MAGNRYNIERFIREYDGTAIGQEVKNMLENGTSYEKICDYADIEFEPEDDGDAMQMLADCGVPFAPDGTPLGIGWDD